MAGFDCLHVWRIVADLRVVESSEWNRKGQQAKEVVKFNNCSRLTLYRTLYWQYLKHNA
jgi:hypothetical protein